MTLTSTLDILYLALAIAVVWIAGFLCWGLYEMARLMRQANEMVTDAREKISRVEKAFASIKEKIESSVNYLAVFASGWKTFLHLFESREERKEQRRKTKKSTEENNEEE